MKAQIRASAYVYLCTCLSLCKRSSSACRQLVQPRGSWRRLLLYTSSASERKRKASLALAVVLRRPDCRGHLRGSLSVWERPREKKEKFLADVRCRAPRSSLLLCHCRSRSRRKKTSRTFHAHERDAMELPPCRSRRKNFLLFANQHSRLARTGIETSRPLSLLVRLSLSPGPHLTGSLFPLFFFLLSFSDNRYGGLIGTSFFPSFPQVLPFSLSFPLAPGVGARRSTALSLSRTSPSIHLSLSLSLSIRLSSYGPLPSLTGILLEEEERSGTEKEEEEATTDRWMARVWILRRRLKSEKCFYREGERGFEE